MTSAQTRARAPRLLPPALALLLVLGAAAPPAAAQEPVATSAATQRILVAAGRSTVLATDFDIVRVAITSPDVANATVVEKRQVLIDGKAAGTVTLIVWGDAVQRQFDVTVEPAVPALQTHLRALFPNENIVVTGTDEGIVLSGRASSAAVAVRATEIAAATSSKARVVNLLQVPGGSDNQQVLLQVRVAEVNRRAVRQLGAALFTSALGVRNTLGRTTTGQFPAPDFDNLKSTKEGSHWWDFGKMVDSAEGEVTFSDFLNIFLFSEKYDLGALIRALSQKGLFQSLAEPNLIAYNGQEASFLAGGEIPVPVVQGVAAGAASSVTVQWKEFGVRLTFRPSIVGDVIRLHVKPEVSSLDFSNGVVLNGFRIPALSTRRTDTVVELRDGQSFAIAGLLDQTAQEQADRIPGLGSIPIIGRLFQSKATSADRTELMVVITPRFVRPLNAGEMPPLPAMPRPFLPPEGVGGALQGGGGLEDAPAVHAEVRGGVR